jgi:hypothetical protein
MFPFLDEVAELLLNYLQQVRAQSEYREVIGQDFFRRAVLSAKSIETLQMHCIT